MPQDTIGPRDGKTYTVSSSREETRMTPKCGFNDAGLPNGGIFRVETRVYEEWSQGKHIRSWTENVEEFVRCYEF